jgi:hypothetical protein
MPMNASDDLDDCTRFLGDVAQVCAPTMHALVRADRDPGAIASLGALMPQ